MPSPGQFPEENPDAAVARRLNILETAGVGDALLPTYLVEKAATVVPSAYPSGWSVMSITTDTSWPLGATDGFVETWVTGAGATGYRIRQTYTGQSGFLMFHRFAATNDTWASWQLTTTYAAATSTTTQYDIVTGSTWETAITLTTTALPSARFNARVIGRAKCLSRNPTVADTQTRLRVRVSLDGGSSYTTGVHMFGTHDAAGSFLPLSAAVHGNGAVSGDIIVQMQAYSPHADTAVDNMFLEVSVVGDH